MVNSPLKSATGDVIRDKAKQMDRWVDHYPELYSRMNVVSEDALIAIESLSTMDELDSKPNWKKLTKLWTNSPLVRPPGRMAYLLKS